jgi:DNA-binding LytR/AlgR family response regulator
VLAAVAATVALAALSVQEYSARHWGGGPISFDTMLFAQGIGAVVWLAFTPTVVGPLAQRYSLWRERLGVVAALHTGAALLVAALHTFVVAVLFASYYYGYSPAAIWDVFRDRMHTGYGMSILIYLLIVGVMSVRRTTAAATETELESRCSERHVRRILARADGRTTILPVEQVDWMEAADNNVIVHVGATSHTVRGPLSAIAARLSPEWFARVHRSSVVNLESVREVQPWFNGELVVILKDQTRLSIGRTYREAFLAALEG